MQKSHRHFWRRFIGALVLAGLANLTYADATVDWQWDAAEEKVINKKLLPKVASLRDGSFSVESAHWRVTTWHTPLFTAQAAAYLDLFAQVFHRAFPFKDAAKWENYRPQVLIYKSQADYRKNAGEVWSAGECQWIAAGTGRPQITIRVYCEINEHDKRPLAFADRAPIGTLQHEATHAMLQQFMGNKSIPSWLNEGVADYYEAWQPRQKITKKGDRPEDIYARSLRSDKSRGPEELQRYYQTHSQEPLPSLSALIDSDGNKFYADNGGEITSRNYMLAESFIDFLMHSKKRRPLLLAMMERVQAGKRVVTKDEEQGLNKEWLVFLSKKWGVVLPKKNIKKQPKRLAERK